MPLRVRLNRTATIWVAIAALVVWLSVRSSAFFTLPTYGTAQTQYQPAHIQNSLLLYTATADFNCDGRVDVLLVRGLYGTNTSVPVSIGLANGTGGFIDGTSQIFTGPVPQAVWPRKILIDDFNGDGRPDIFIADHGNDTQAGGYPGYQNTLLLSTNSCQLADATANLPQQYDFTHSAASADIDNDGDVDLFVGNIYGANQVPPQIWLNNGTGTFTVSTGRLPVAQVDLNQNKYTASLFVDVNGDDNPDLILGGQNDFLSQSLVLVNDGSGRFTPLANAIPSKPFGTDSVALDIKSADFNHDGWNDLVIVFTKPSYQGRWEQILINNGNGTFSDQTSTLLPQVDNSSQWDIWAHVVDLDGDGNHDLIAESIDTSAGNRYFTANASGQFTNVPFLSGLNGLFAMVDANGDGHRDILTFGFLFGFEQAWLRHNVSAVLPPGVPLGVRASRGLSGHIRIYWPYVWGATGYEVWRSSTAGALGTQIGTVTGATSFDDVTATQGMPWYYRVRALNSAGTSGNSLVTSGFAVQELISNGSFSSGASGWTAFATDGTGPNGAYIQSSIVNGVLEFTRVAPPPGTSNQATVFEQTGIPISSGTAVAAQFDLGNSSLVRKRVSVLLVDSDFSDISVCTFWLPPQTALRTYTMQAHTTKAWTNASIYFYAATAGTNGGAYRLDNVSLHATGSGSITRTVCGDPSVPAPSGVPDAAELLTNNSFASGTTGWTVFGNLSYLLSGSFYFIRPSPEAGPAGVLLQPTNHGLDPGTIVTARFTLANTSPVRKRVTVLLHDLDFSDLAACTFWIPPGQLMSPAVQYTVRTYTTKAWSNATFSIYAATVGNDMWSAIDDVTFHTTPGTATSGTDCGEPGSALSPAPLPVLSPAHRPLRR
jgi:hypothetical protein